MRFVNPDKTLLEQAERVSRFEDFCADIIDRQGRSESDARSIHLQNMRSAATASADILRILHWSSQKENTSLATVLGLKDPTHADMHQSDLLRAGRLNFLVEVQFQIETLFRNFLAALKKRPPTGFYNLATEVVAVSGIADQPKKLELLSVPALIRNSMHANGVHHGYKNGSTKVTIQRIDFVFDHGKKVECGSWLHITTALTSGVEIVEEILNSGPVSGLQHLDDEYSMQAAAKP